MDLDQTDPYLWLTDPDPDPTPDLTPFFSDIKDATKINLLLKFYFASIFMRKEKDPDPYL